MLGCDLIVFDTGTNAGVWHGFLIPATVAKSRRKVSVVQTVVGCPPITVARVVHTVVGGHPALMHTVSGGPPN